MYLVFGPSGPKTRYKISSLCGLEANKFAHSEGDLLVLRFANVMFKKLCMVSRFQAATKWRDI